MAEEFQQVIKRKATFQNLLQISSVAEYITAITGLSGDVLELTGVSALDRFAAWQKCILLNENIFDLTPEQLSDGNSEDNSHRATAGDYLFFCSNILELEHAESQFRHIFYRITNLPRRNQEVSDEQFQRLAQMFYMSQNCNLNLLGEFLDSPFTPNRSPSDGMFKTLLKRSLRLGEADKMAFLVRRGLRFEEDEKKSLFFNVLKNVQISEQNYNVTELACANQMMLSLNLDPETHREMIERTLRSCLHLPPAKISRNPGVEYSYTPRMKAFDNIIAVTAFLTNHGIALCSFEFAENWLQWVANSVEVSERYDDKPMLNLLELGEECMNFLISQGAQTNWEDLPNYEFIQNWIESGLCDFNNKLFLQTEEGAIFLLQNNLLSTDLCVWIFQILYGKW